MLGGRTSQGKSAFALQIAWDLAEQGFRTWYVSLEMTADGLFERLFCNVMKINNRALLEGLGKSYVKEMDDFLKNRCKVKFILTDNMGKTFREISDVVLMAANKPQVIIIDYIQATKAEKVEEERRAMNEYLMQFRNTCLKDGIVGIAVSQINRKAETTRHNKPSMSQLKGTGVLEEHADTVLLLHWDWHYTHNNDKFNEYDVIIAKQRNGVTGEHKLTFHPQYYRFEEFVELPKGFNYGVYRK